MPTPKKAAPTRKAAVSKAPPASSRTTQKKRSDAMTVNAGGTKGSRKKTA